jgi:hypothetical protein
LARSAIFHNPIDKAAALLYRHVAHAGHTRLIFVRSKGADSVITKIVSNIF